MPDAPNSSEKSMKVSIEGPGAAEALAELLAIDGLRSLTPSPSGDEVSKSIDPGYVAIAQIIVAGAGTLAAIATITEKIVNWRDARKKAAETARFSVVLEDANGQRIRLEKATPDQIARALTTLLPPPQEP